MSEVEQLRAEIEQLKAKNKGLESDRKKFLLVYYNYKKSVKDLSKICEERGSYIERLLKVCKENVATIKNFAESSDELLKRYNNLLGKHEEFKRGMIKNN